ncbi:MAG: hypothetical protein CL569_16800 [Alphaproteobacteria bacterium]|nr:hypothetical protein [Alphaproteobacteria bacterium]
MTSRVSPNDFSAVERWIILSVLAFASGLAMLSLTIANAILPQMQGDLSAGFEEISWVVTATMTATAIAMSAAGWISSRLGQRRALIICGIGFTISCAMLGVADGLGEVIFWRACQGMFAGPIPPMSITVVLNIFPMREHGPATMGMTAGYALAPSMGPVMGAYLTDIYSWHVAFTFMALLGVILLLLIMAKIPAMDRRPGLRLDWFGLLTLAIALGAAQWTLDRGNHEDWFESPEILTSAIIVGFATYLFLAHSLTTRQPFVDLRIFLDKNYVIALIFWSVAGVLEFVPLVLMPTLLGRLQEMPVEIVGILLAPRGIGFMFGIIIFVSLVKFVSSKTLLMVGMSFHIPALWYLSTFDMTVGLEQFVYAGILLGIAESITFSGATTIGFSTLALDLRGYGSAIFFCGRFFMTSAGISIFVTLLSRSTQSNHASISEFVSPFNQALPLINKAVFWDTSSLSGLARLDGEITRQSVMIGYLNDFWILLVLSIAVMPLILLIDRPAARKN